MSAHARLAPSAASRWMKCPGSVALGEKAESLLGTTETQSAPAALGTALHEAAEDCLKRGEFPAETVGRVYNEIQVQPEHIERFEAYVTLVRGLVEEFGGEPFYEVRVHFSEDCWGTADCCIVYQKKGIWRLAVIDLKTGSGVAVDAWENYQLLVYGIGAYDQLAMLGYDEIKYIDLVISQPILRDKPSIWTVDNLELEVYRQEILDGIERVEDFPTMYEASEDACRWCRGRAICPALSAKMEESRKIDLALMTSDNLAEALDLVPLVKAWISGVEDFSKEFMLEGNLVPGYKVVQGRRMRGWVDIDKAQRYLKARVPKFQANCFNMKFKTPAQIEKMLRTVEARKEVDMDKIVKWSEGSPTIADETDSRDEYVRPGAAKDFAEVADNE